MSLCFSNTSTKNGIIQSIERKLDFNDGDISGNGSLLTNFTADINLALDRVFSIIFRVGGTWQFDDNNHTGYPIISRDIVSGQRSYTFVNDEQGNMILEIQKVFISDEDGLFREIVPTDIPTGASSNYWDGLNTTGQPNSYDKNANGIFLNPIPNYNATNGLKIYISREGSYFVSSDTIKVPGFAGLFHDYLAIYPSHQYALRKGLKTVSLLENEMLKMEASITEYYKSRERDVQKVMTSIIRSSH